MTTLYYKFRSLVCRNTPRTTSFQNYSRNNSAFALPEPGTILVPGVATIILKKEPSEIRLVMWVMLAESSSRSYLELALPFDNINIDKVINGLTKLSSYWASM